MLTRRPPTDEAPLLRRLRSLAGSKIDERLGVLLALAIFPMMLLASPGNSSLKPPQLALLLAWPLVAAVASIYRAGPVVATYLVVGGSALRLAGFGGGGRGSDVLRVVEEAIRVALGGGNPYDHIYLDVQKHYSTTVYPPFQLLLHLPGHVLGGLDGVRFTEIVAAVAVMLLLALLARRAAWTVVLPVLAVYASLPNLALLSYDGSNDTSAGAILLVAVLSVAWAQSTGWQARAVGLAGLIAGSALGTKQTTVFVVLMLVLYLWRAAGSRALARYVGAAAVVLLMISLPFLALDPIRYLSSLALASVRQGDVFGWNVWVLVQMLGLGVPDRAITAALSLSVVFSATLLAALLRFRDLASAVFAGILVTMAALLTARWTTHAYFGMLAPVLLAVPPLMLLGIPRRRGDPDSEARGRRPGSTNPLGGRATSTLSMTGRLITAVRTDGPRLARSGAVVLASAGRMVAGAGPRAIARIRWDRLVLLPYLAALIAGLALMIVVSTALPGTGDYGQWLMTARYYMGQPIPDYRDLSALPPLVPAALALIWRAVGDPVLSLRVFDVLLVAGIAIGFAAFGWALFRSREAAFASAVVALLVTDRFTELLSFGGLLQEAALALTLLSLAAFSTASRGPRRRVFWWWIGAITLGLVGVSHVGTAVIAVPTGVAIATLSFLRLRQRDSKTSLMTLAPLAIVLIPLAAYWLVVLLPANQTYATNPASLSYRGPEALASSIRNYWPNVAIIAIGFLSIGWGAFNEAKRRSVGPYLILFVWAAMAWGFLAYTIVVRSSTDYPRFASVLVPPLVIAAAGRLAALSRRLARLRSIGGPGRQRVALGIRLAGRKSAREVALALLAVVAVAFVPSAVDRYGDLTRVYGAPEEDALVRSIVRLDEILPLHDTSVLTQVSSGKLLEGLTGRAALFNLPVRYSFRPREWQRSVDADVVGNATAALANEFFLVEYPGRARSWGVEAPVGLVIAANHGGEFVDLLTLDQRDTSIGSSTAGTLLANLLPTGLTSFDNNTEASVRTEWQGAESAESVSFARTVRLAAHDATLSLTDESPSGVVESVFRAATGIAITSLETSGNEAHVCFSQRGNTMPCLALRASDTGARFDSSNDGGLRIIGSVNGRTELQITALTPGAPIVGLQVLDPREVVTKYRVGAAILYADDPAYDETLGRLGVLGFGLSFQEGPYAVLLGESQASQASIP
jgi:hypothetical protein